MSIEHDGRDHRDAGRRRAHTMDGFDGERAPQTDSGGMTARWQARLRLQQDRRGGVRDRRLRHRSEGQSPDRRLAG